MNRISLPTFVLPVLSFCTILASGADNQPALTPNPRGHVQQSVRADWLLKHDETSMRTGRLSLSPNHMVEVSGLSTPLMRQGSSGGAVLFAPAVSVTQESKPAGVGVYALEFGGAAVGTCVAAAASYVVAGRPVPGDMGSRVFLGLGTYAVTSALLSSTSTHLVAELAGQRRSFPVALAGGAVGGLFGAWALLRNNVNPGPAILGPAGLVLPPMCAVVAYNIF